MVGEPSGDYVQDILTMAGAVWLIVGVLGSLWMLCRNGLKGVPRPRREAFSWATNVASSAAMATALLMFAAHIFDQRLAEKGIAAAAVGAIVMGAAVVLLPKLFARTKRE